ncbi:hypothetical protein TNCV_3133781 [Trichonephila clavipes]|nr:hypothetical protein TNCV_3133781 [Trichonephila clavipes]
MSLRHLPAKRAIKSRQTHLTQKPKSLDATVTTTTLTITTNISFVLLSTESLYLRTVELKDNSAICIRQYGPHPWTVQSYKEYSLKCSIDVFQKDGDSNNRAQSKDEITPQLQDEKSPE